MELINYSLINEDVKNTKLCIYKILNKINGKFYIGQSKNEFRKRLVKHVHQVKIGKNQYLYDAIRHYGWDNFEFSIIETVSDFSYLNDREKYWIEFYNTTDKNIGYNMTPGGLGNSDGYVLKEYAKSRIGIPLSEETKRKISEANKGRSGAPCSDERKKYYSDLYKGKMPKKPIQEIMKERNLPPARKGAKHSEESKKKMSVAKTGKCFKTREQIMDLAAKHTGESHPNYVAISKEELGCLIKLHTPIEEIATKFGCSKPTIFTRVKAFWNVKRFREVREILKDEKLSICGDDIINS